MIIVCLGAGALAGLGAALVSYLVYPNLWVALMCYIFAGHLAALAVIWVFGRRPVVDAEMTDDPDLEHELAALRESAREDKRFHAGTPDYQQAILFRTLRHHEDADPKGKARARLTGLA